ncbi:YIP1 family protein [Rubrobacter marinus]|uniref:YIP1 family protein n=1 Tax=Rubrobacter marinus TaxID=2653852 RepID=UPI0014085530|nr:YIP1 family protein [Rubrobacter marinus]
MKDRTDGARTRRHGVSDPNARYHGFAPLYGAPDGEGGAGEEFDPYCPVRSFAGVAASVLVSPGRFFSGIEPHGPARYALLFALACSVVSYALERTAGRALAAVLPGPGSVPAGPDLAGLVLAAPLSLLGLLFSAFAVHLLARPFLARGLGIGATLRVACYANATAVLAWVPVLGALTPLYWLCLVVIGLRALHRSALLLEEDEGSVS